MTLVLGAACGRSSPEAVEPGQQPDVVVQVINHNFNDMTVYAHHGAGGRMLGLASGHRVSEFRVPWGRVNGVDRFRLSVDPVGRGGRLFSGYLQVEPGSLVTWTLEPNLRSSNVSVVR
jgi:hypothetical protein